MSAFGLDQRDLDLLRAVFRKVPGLAHVYVYGSRARGDFRSTSDLDLATEFSSGAEVGRARLAWELEDLPLIYKIDVVDLAELPAGPFRDEVLAQRKPLYERKEKAPL